MTSHDLLTVNEVAERLKVSARQVRRLIEWGELDYIRAGRGPRAAIRVHRWSLERFLARPVVDKDA